MDTESREPGTDLIDIDEDAATAPPPATPPPAAPPARLTPDELLRACLREDPWGIRFFQMVRLLERLHPERKPVGLFVSPQNEVVRFRAHTSLSFPASEIQSYDVIPNGPDRLSVNFMGLSTMNGPLPHPYIELLLDRIRAKDHATGEFFDIFNHRLVSLFYRGWKKYRFFIAYELSAGRDDPMTGMIYDLLGLGTAGLRRRMEIPDEAAIYYAGILSQKRRSAQGLKQILEDYFAVPVCVEQFTGTWNRLQPSDRTVLADQETEAERLGLGTILGDEVWDQQGTLTIRLGPMPLKQYREFLPGAAAHTQLGAWLRFYARQEYDFIVRLVLERDDVPQMSLTSDESQMGRLGFASWLRLKPFERDPDDATYRMQ